MRSRFWAPLVGPPVWAAVRPPVAPEPVEMPSYDRPADVPPPVEMPVVSGPPLRGAYARRAAR